MPRSQKMRLVEVAEYLGISKQRAHQLANQDDLPRPVAEDRDGRLWERASIEAWARREWWGTRPWRKR